MDFIKTALAMLPLQWFVMAVLTVIPMALAIPRFWALTYLVSYALSGAYVVYWAMPEKTKIKPHAKADDRLGMFARIRLQDP
jgi:hypothetical protein